MAAPIPDAMLTAAARELCRQHADVCDVNEDDAWNTYSEDFRVDARAILVAIDAGELVAALRGVVAVADRQTDEFDRARAAISKATQGAT